MTGSDPPPVPELFPDFVRLALSMEREEFDSRYDHPFLVVITVREDDGDRPGFGTSGMHEAALEGETLVGGTGGIGELTPDQESLIRPVRKRGGHHYDIVTVGRTRNNDVWLPDRCVSKFHAYFEQGDDGWCVADAGSTNGTAVEGEELEARSPRPIDSGTSITFAGVFVCTFFEAGPAHDFCGYYRRFAS